MITSKDTVGINDDGKYDNHRSIATDSGRVHCTVRMDL